jgi:hypothetical protein
LTFYLLKCKIMHIKKGPARIWQVPPRCQNSGSFNSEPFGSQVAYGQNM